MQKHLNRNKDKYNPYTLDIDEETNTYIVEFKDTKNIIHRVEVSEKVYEAFDRFELEDISQIHKIKKYIERNEDRFCMWNLFLILWIDFVLY